uniref:E4 protein n=1 Tax=Human papillomavirus TaxID=10566 RepID=A0A385PLC1_9PAPI|nr:MAG: E4 protein [Human papillomavirus]
MVLKFKYTMIMILKTVWCTHNGTPFTIRTCRTIGIKPQGKWITMVYHLLIILMKKDTFYYFMKMLVNMVRLDNGLLNTKLQLFPLLLLAQPSDPPSTPKKATISTGSPGSPHRRKVPLGEDFRGILKKYPQLPPHRQPREENDIDEDDEEKENQPPETPPAQNGDEGPLMSLLRKWDHDINQFRNIILQDLEDLKRKLGIHFSSA